MITHNIGADTRLDYQWTTEDGDLIVPTSASFEVTNAVGASVSHFDLGDPGLQTSAEHSIELHLEDTYDIEPGLYSYALKVSDGIDEYFLSGGLLRAR